MVQYLYHFFSKNIFGALWVEEGIMGRTHVTHHIKTIQLLSSMKYIHGSSKKLSKHLHWTQINYISSEEVNGFLLFTSLLFVLLAHYFIQIAPADNWLVCCDESHIFEIVRMLMTGCVL